MSDYNSGLPIRSEADGADEKVIVKVIDGTGGGSNQMSVDADKNAHVEMHGNDPASLDRVMRLSELGAVTPDGVYHATNNTKPGTLADVVHERNATPGDAQATIRHTGISAGTVHAADVALFDENGVPFSTSNPLPVTSVDSEGDEINDYVESTAVPAGSTVNHDYTVTALKTLKLQQIEASGSGKILVEVQVETGVATGIYTTKWKLRNSTAQPNVSLWLKELMSVAAGVKVRVAITNKDNQSQDVNSTMSGHEI